MPKRARHGNLALGHLTRRQHTKLLAAPNYRVVQDYEENKRYKPLPRRVPRAALRAKTPARIYSLSIPKRLCDVPINRELIRKIKERIPLQEKPKHYVTPAALNSKINAQIERLAISPKHTLESNLEFGVLQGRNIKGAIEKKIKQCTPYPWKIARTGLDFHSKSHHILEKKYPKPAKKSKSERKIRTKEDWERCLALLTKLAIPKKCHKPKSRRKRPAVPMAKLEARILELCQPKSVYEKPLSLDEMFKVKEATLKCQASDRVRELAVPRMIVKEEEPVLTAAGVSPAALAAKPSPRVLELSTPVKKKQAEDECKEDAFKVPKRALNAICTKRTEQLARPIERK